MFCSHCGKEIPAESTFCQYCGKSIADSRPEKKVIPFKYPKGIAAVRIFVAVCLAFLLISDLLRGSESYLTLNLFGALSTISVLDAFAVVTEVFAYITLAVLVFTVICSYVNMGNFSFYVGKIGMYIFVGLYALVLIFTLITCISSDIFVPSGIFYVSVLVLIIECFLTFAPDLVQKITKED